MFCNLLSMLSKSTAAAFPWILNSEPHFNPQEKGQMGHLRQTGLNPCCWRWRSLIKIKGWWNAVLWVCCCWIADITKQFLSDDRKWSYWLLSAFGTPSGWKDEMNNPIGVIVWSIVPMLKNLGAVACQSHCCHSWLSALWWRKYSTWWSWFSLLPFSAVCIIGYSVLNLGFLVDLRDLENLWFPIMMTWVVDNNIKSFRPLRRRDVLSLF